MLQGIENRLAAFTLFVALAISLVALRPELAITRADLNDNVFHYTLAERMVEAVERGENPLDFWASEWSLGYPVFRTYQPLAHGMVALLYFALGKSVALPVLFAWVRYLLLALLPLTFYAAARLLTFNPLAAAAAAVVSPLVATGGLYGVEYGSFVWAGNGLYPQLLATHLLLLSLGLGYRAVRTGRGLAAAGLLGGLTFLAHFIYGYMAAVSLWLPALLPDAEIPRRRRMARAALIGAAALAACAFQLAPLVADGALVNHSRWEPAWKWDSFGAWYILSRLFRGELLDFGRFPALSLLALAGAALCARRRRAPACGFLLAGAGLWLAMLFGRPSWGAALKLLGVFEDMQLHRVIGGAHVFLALLAAAALGAAWEWGLARRPRWQGMAAVAASLLLLAPAVRERARYLANNAAWGRKNLEAVAGERAALESAIAQAGERGGRVYPGLAAGWGGRFRVGDVPVHAFLSVDHVPTVSFLYHAMALTGDLMVRFNGWNPAHYRLFGILTVLAPPEVSLPPFLRPAGQSGRVRILDAPGGSYFDLVDAPFAVRATRYNLYDVNDRWLASDWVAARLHLRLDPGGAAGPEVPRLSPDDPLPQFPTRPAAGAVTAERRDGETYRAEIEAARPCFALFKMTSHPNWRVTVDGAPRRAVTLSPGFPGVEVSAGHHEVEWRYEPGPWRMALAIAGLCFLALIAVLERRGWLLRLAAPWRWRTAAGLAALALPVCTGLFTARLPDGHDAMGYFPRLVEFHENIVNGVLLPRWAPDLAQGNGQPLFLFNPPMIYYLGEFWHLLGFDFVTAMNLACATVVLASAIGAFLLGRLYFGEAGGWLASAAYVYAPYFSVDLYVRAAWAELAACPFFALTLYGFGAYAKRRRRGYLLLGAAAYAGVLFSHHAAALLFTPLAAAFICFTGRMEKSWAVLRAQAGGLLLGLGLAACIWLPALTERQYISLGRLLEGYLRYSNHFVYLHQLVYSPWGYGLSVPGYHDGMSFALGWGHLLVALAALVWARGRPGLLRFFAIAAACLSILMLEDALWLWDHVPLLQYIQFPWRLLGPVALCVAMAAGALGEFLPPLAGRRRIAFGASLALLIVPNLRHLEPKQFREIDLAFWTPAQIAARGVEVTTAREYAPRWMLEAPPHHARRPAVISGAAKIRPSRHAPDAWTGTVRAAAPSLLEMPTVWFPGWRVRMDGREVAATIAERTGLIRVTVPPGGHEIEARFTRSAPRRIGDVLSALSLALFAAFVIHLVLPGRRAVMTRESPACPAPPRRVSMTS